MGVVAFDGGGSTSVTSASSHDLPVQPAPGPKPNAQEAAALAALKAALEAAQEARTREAQQAAAEKVKAAMENAMRAYADGKTGSARTAALADAGAAIGKLAPSGGDAGKLFSSMAKDATQSVSAETPALSSVRQDAFALATAQDKLKQDQADLAALRKVSPKLASMDQQEGGAQALSAEQRHIDQLQQTLNTAVEHEYDATQAPKDSKDPDSARLAIVLGNHAHDGVQGDIGSLLTSHILHDEMAHPQTAGLTDADKQMLKNDPLSFALSSLMARNPDDSSLQLSLVKAASAMRPSYAHDLIAKAPDLATKLSVLNAQMAAAGQSNGAAGRKAVLDAAGSDITPQALEKSLDAAIDATQPFQVHAGPQASAAQQKATNAGEWLSSTLANGCPNELRGPLLDALMKHLGKDAPDIGDADNVMKGSFFDGVSKLVSGDPASAKKAAQWLLSSRDGKGAASLPSDFTAARSGAANGDGDLWNAISAQLSSNHSVPKSAVKALTDSISKGNADRLKDLLSKQHKQAFETFKADPQKYVQKYFDQFSSKDAQAKLTFSQTPPGGGTETDAQYKTRLRNFIGAALGYSPTADALKTATNTKSPNPYQDWYSGNSDQAKAINSAIDPVVDRILKEDGDRKTALSAVPVAYASSDTGVGNTALFSLHSKDHVKLIDLTGATFDGKDGKEAFRDLQQHNKAFSSDGVLAVPKDMTLNVKDGHVEVDTHQAYQESWEDKLWHVARDIGVGVAVVGGVVIAVGTAGAAVPEELAVGSVVTASMAGTAATATAGASAFIAGSTVNDMLEEQAHNQPYMTTANLGSLLGAAAGGLYSGSALAELQGFKSLVSTGTPSVVSRVLTSQVAGGVTAGLSAGATGEQVSQVAQDWDQMSTGQKIESIGSLVTPVVAGVSGARVLAGQSGYALPFAQAMAAQGRSPQTVDVDSGHGATASGSQTEQLVANVLGFSPERAVVIDASQTWGPLENGIVQNNTATLLNYASKELDANNAVIFCNTASAQTNEGVAAMVGNAVLNNIVDKTSQFVFANGGDHPAFVATNSTVKNLAFPAALSSLVKGGTFDPNELVAFQKDPNVDKTPLGGSTKGGGPNFDNLVTLQDPANAAPGTPLTVASVSGMNIADLVNETPPKSDPGYPAWLSKLQAAAKVSVQNLPKDTTSLTMACTHYVTDDVVNAFKSALHDRGMDNVRIINPNQNMADLRTQQILATKGWKNFSGTANAKTVYYMNIDPSQFDEAKQTITALTGDPDPIVKSLPDNVRDQILGKTAQRDNGVALSASLTPEELSLIANGQAIGANAS
jgi:glutamate racemase